MQTLFSTECVAHRPVTGIHSAYRLRIFASFRIISDWFSFEQRRSESTELAHLSIKCSVRQLIYFCLKKEIKMEREIERKN